MRGEGVLVVRLASVVGCRLPLRRLRREPWVPLVCLGGLHCTGGGRSALPRTVECRLLVILYFSS